MQQQLTSKRGKHAAASSIVALTLATTLMIPLPAFADPTSAAKQADAQAALASINALQSDLDQVSQDYDAAALAKSDAESKRDEAQQRLDEVNTQIADLQERLGSRATSMYRSGSTSFVDLLLGAASFSQFATNWDLLVSINEGDAELVQQSKDLRAEAQTQEATYTEQSRLATEKANEAKRMQDETASTMAAMKTTYDGLSAEAAELLASERAAQVAAEEAAAASVVESAIEQASNPDSGTVNNDGGNTSNNGGGGYVPTPTPDPGYDAGASGSVVGRASSQLGKGYGYSDPSYGAGPNEYDCSGFVAYCLTGSYSRMGSTSTFLGWQRVSDPQPGDVAVNGGHCGIYIGGGQMIHASTYGVGVITGPVQSGMVFVRY